MKKFWITVLGAGLVAALLTSAPVSAVVDSVVRSVGLTSLTGLGTNVATALGINIGTTGAVLVKGTSACADLSDAGTACTTTYSQSTCTVTFIGTTVAGTTQTYNNQSCTYERVGRDVIMRFDLNMSSLGNATGNVTVGGLPVPAAGGDPSGGCMAQFVNMNGTSPPTALLLIINSGTSTIQVYGATAAPVALSITQAGAAFRVNATCIYRSA